MQDGGFFIGGIFIAASQDSHVRLFAKAVISCDIV
jgi:hypothetical protein